jgi:hypothetical protein
MIHLFRRVRMNYRGMLTGGAMLALCGWCGDIGTVMGADTSAPRPNIILCMTDDQGWGDVSYNGLKQIQTPNLDSMAAAGMRFTRRGA